MSNRYGRINHSDNTEQELFDGYVSWLIKQIKKLPKGKEYRQAREKYFEALTKNRKDKEKLKQAIINKYNAPTNV